MCGRTSLVTHFASQVLPTEITKWNRHKPDPNKYGSKKSSSGAFQVSAVENSSPSRRNKLIKSQQYPRYTVNPSTTHKLLVKAGDFCWRGTVDVWSMWKENMDSELYLFIKNKSFESGLASATLSSDAPRGLALSPVIMQRVKGRVVCGHCLVQHLWLSDHATASGITGQSSPSSSRI